MMLMIYTIFKKIVINNFKKKKKVTFCPLKKKYTYSRR